MYLPGNGERRRVIEAAKGRRDLSNQLLLWNINAGGGEHCERWLNGCLPAVMVVDGGVEKVVCHRGPNEEEETMAAMS